MCQDRLIRLVFGLIIVKLLWADVDPKTDTNTKNKEGYDSAASKIPE